MIFEGIYCSPILLGLRRIKFRKCPLTCDNELFPKHQLPEDSFSIIGDKTFFLLLNKSLTKTSCSCAKTQYDSARLARNGFILFSSLMKHHDSVAIQLLHHFSSGHVFPNVGFADWFVIDCESMTSKIFSVTSPMCDFEWRGQICSVPCYSLNLKKALRVKSRDTENALMLAVPRSVTSDRFQHFQRHQKFRKI